MNKLEQADHDIRVKRGLIDEEPVAEEPAADAEPDADADADADTE